jgi:type II secretory pathway pseudopilin PulG
MRFSKRKIHRKNGFSVIEILIASVIAILALSTVFYLFKSSRNSMSETQEKVSVLHQGRMFLEYLKRDLRSLYFNPLNPDTTWQLETNKLVFHKLSDGNSIANFEKITYNWDKDSQQVYRKSANTQEIFGNENVKIRSLLFEKEEIEEEGNRSVAIHIVVKLSNKEADKRSQFTLEGRIFPPILQQSLIAEP